MEEKKWTREEKVNEIAANLCFGKEIEVTGINSTGRGEVLRNYVPKGQFWVACTAI